MSVVGWVEIVWRYPVKSMPGEALPGAVVAEAMIRAGNAVEILD
jgi:uncharacterized protein YcbX